MIDENRTTSVVDYLVRQGWTYKLTNQDAQRYLGRCPVGNHDNDDTNPRFSVHANGIAFCCFKCGFQGGGVRSLKEQMGQDTESRVRPAAPMPKAKAPTANKAKPKWQGATVRQLCDAKGIDYEYATSTLGWKDTTYGRSHTPAVAIPYYDTDGQIIDTRFRVGISDGTRMVSRFGSKALPYGLQNLHDYRAGNYIILQEGETDWATLDALAYNALGLPGVNSFKPEWTVHLNGIKTIYVWQESGGHPDRKGRTPGQQMVHRISTYRGQVWVLEAPPEGKDPCELRQKLGDEAFMSLLDQMMLDAKPYDANAIERAEAKANNPTKPTAIHKHHKDGDADLDELTAKLDNPTWVLGSSFEKFDGCDSVDRDMRRTALRLGKPVNLTTSVLKHREEFKKQYPKIEEFYPLSQQGVKLLDFCFFMENPHLIAPHQQIENLVSGALGQVDLSGQPVPAYVAIVDCGRESSMSCDVHGAAWCGTHKCYQGFDPNCGTQASGQAAKVKIPNLEGSAQYLHVVFQTRDVLPDNADHWGPIFSKQIDTWQKTMAKASMWKAGKDRLYSRSHATYYGIEDGKTVATTTWKILFHEVEEGCLDKIIIRIATAMDAIVFDQRRWQKGQNAALQIVADFMSHFIGIDQSISQGEQAKIFLAHYNSTRGRHIFQAYGLLRKLIIELPAPEPQICPEPGCGLTLHEVLLPRPPSGKIGGASPYHDRRN